MEYDINKPWLTLDPWQIEYIEETKNCLLRCGRQSGKSTAASIKIIECAIKEKAPCDYLVIALTENQAYALFFKCLMYCTARYPQMIKLGKDKPTKHIITLKNGVRINCYAAGEEGMALRHFTLKKLWMDEAAPMAREVFIAVSPMLSVTGGSMDLLGTPQGKQGFFWECSKREDFRQFHVSAEDCPRHKKEFLEQEKKNMTPLEYAQEYLGEFIDEFRRVFSEEWIKKVCVLKAPDSIDTGKKHYLGVDIARMGEDLSSFQIIKKIDKDHYEHVFSEVTSKTLTTETEQKIIDIDKIYGKCLKEIDIDAGSGSLGVSILDHLIQPSSPVKDKIKAINNREMMMDREGEKKKKLMKEDLYNSLVALGHWNKIKLLDDEEIRTSLASVQFEPVIHPGKMTSIRIFGNYTHTAEALIRAVWGATHDTALELWWR